MESMVNKSFWIDRPTFVTGGTGLLGSWLVKKLLELKADVVCLVRDWVPQSELVLSKTIEKVKIVRGDIRDETLLERVLGEYEIDTVFHLAARQLSQLQIAILSQHLRQIYREHGLYLRHAGVLPL